MWWCVVVCGGVWWCVVVVERYVIVQLRHQAERFRMHKEKKSQYECGARQTIVSYGNILDQ